MEAEYVFRPYEKDDIPFIQSSWGNSYYQGASYNKHISAEEFHASHRPIREAFLCQPNAMVIVCVYAKDPSVIIGWMAVEKPAKADAMILHYIYVKHAFQDMGIATALIKRLNNPKEILVTHLTEKADRIMRHNPEKFDNYFFAPHLT